MNPFDYVLAKEKQLQKSKQEASMTISERNEASEAELRQQIDD